MHFNMCLVFFLTMIHTAPGEPTPKLKLIGTIGSHSYFYDIEKRTWRDSLEYCKSLQMDLADLPTQSHLQLIKNYANTDPEFFAGGTYWTSGQDSMKLTQFSWRNTNEPVAADLSFSEVYGPNTCLAVDRYGVFYGAPVDYRFGVLCQS